MEVCNKVDDDCDGQPDEGFDLARDPNHCGACGVVCAVNNGQASCVNSQCAVGSCNNGYVDLNEEAADGCECAQTNNGVEACNGSDDDCDGKIDEGFDVGVACSAGVGACEENGQKECTADGQGTECSVDGAPRGVEICNNIDDDCDGRKDEGFDGDDDGFKTCINGIDCTQPCPAGQDCAGCALSDCDDGLANINPNTPEICGDNVDQNCDGRDAPCIVPAARMSRLAFVSNMNRGKCADMNGDGQPDNILTTAVPAGVINAIIGPAFQEGSSNRSISCFSFTGENSNVDANFELATVNATQCQSLRCVTSQLLTPIPMSARE